jgi:hypothetical protein
MKRESSQSPTVLGIICGPVLIMYWKISGAFGIEPSRLSKLAASTCAKVFPSIASVSQPQAPIARKELPTTSPWQECISPCDHLHPRATRSRYQAPTTARYGSLPREFRSRLLVPELGTPRLGRHGSLHRQYLLRSAFSSLLCCHRLPSLPQLDFQSDRMGGPILIRSRMNYSVGQ